MIRSSALGCVFGALLVVMVGALWPPEPVSTTPSNVCPALDTPATCRIENLVSQ